MFQPSFDKSTFYSHKNSKKHFFANYLLIKINEISIGRTERRVEKLCSIHSCVRSERTGWEALVLKQVKRYSRITTPKASTQQILSQPNHTNHTLMGCQTKNKWKVVPQLLLKSYWPSIVNYHELLRDYFWECARNEWAVCVVIAVRYETIRPTLIQAVCQCPHMSVCQTKSTTFIQIQLIRLHTNQTKKQWTKNILLDRQLNGPSPEFLPNKLVFRFFAWLL